MSGDGDGGAAPAAAEPLAGRRRSQTAIGCAVLLLGLGLAYGAADIASEAGYAGVGPNFLPWALAVALSVCGVLLVVQARAAGGWPSLETPSGAPRGDWRALAWVVAGIVANAVLLTRIGFVPACTLCFVLAVRGLRASEGKPHGGMRGLLRDALTGFLIAAPAFWLFTKLLAINLPGLTGTGWL